MFEREPLAGAAEAGDHLVGDQQHLVAVADLAQAGEVVVGRRVDAARALDRLGDHRGDRVRTFLLDRGHDVVDHQIAAVDPTAAGRRHIRCGRVDDVGNRTAELGLEDLHARGGGHRDRVAVVCLDAGDDLLLLGSTLLDPVEPGRLDIGLVRLGAGVGEVDRLHVVVGELDHLLREANRRLVGVALVGVGESELGHLLLGRFAEFLTTVSDGDVPERRQAVDVALTVGSVDVDALSALEHDRLLVEVGMEERVHPVVEVILNERAVLGVIHCWAPLDLAVLGGRVCAGRLLR